MRIFSLGLVGIQPFTVEIEAAFAKGLPSVTILGLPSELARDLRERVQAALLAIGDRSLGGKWTLSVSSPVDLRLSRLGTECLDLPVALLMIASHSKILGAVLQSADHRVLAAGELSLSGALRPLSVWAPLVRWTENEIARHGHTHDFSVITPPSLSPLYDNKTIEHSYCLSEYDDTTRRLIPRRFALGHLSELPELLNKFWPSGPPRTGPASLRGATARQLPIVTLPPDAALKACYEFTAAKKMRLIQQARDPFLAVLALSALYGRLHVLLAGPPGVGKTFLAELMSREQPEPTPAERATLALIHGESRPIVRPTRKPHHSATLQSLTGGARLNIGELGLSHAGILFLDELPEFSSSTLDSLREPMDEGKVRLSRAGGQLDYPSDFQLVATMNPCPCGYFMSVRQRCRCIPSRVRAYLGKAGGPLLDRFHVLAWVDPCDPAHHEAARLCSMLLNPQQHGVSFPFADDGLPLGPVASESSRSSARVHDLARCLEGLFPESPEPLLRAVIGHLRRFSLLVRESENLV